MQFVVFGAGAIGGVVGGRLHQAGHAVTLVARGAHLGALCADGLVLESPGRRDVLDVPVVGDVRDIPWSEDLVVLLSVKSQDTEGALDRLREVAGPRTPVVCMQNGVENERRVRRRFARTYAMCVMSPTTHLAPGVVQAHSAPVTGLLDVGCYPSGVDGLAREVAAALSSATFDSRPLADVMRWKYCKLLMNLTNSVEALCGPAARGSELGHLVRSEGTTVLDASGIAYASPGEDAERRGDRMSMAPTPSGAWAGGSSWQSLARGTGSIEADYLNGEIALLGALAGVPTPANSLVQRLAVDAARQGAPAAQCTPEELLAQLE